MLKILDKKKPKCDKYILYIIYVQAAIVILLSYMYSWLPKTLVFQGKCKNIGYQEFDLCGISWTKNKFSSS